MTLWDLIRDFFVMHVFGGTTSQDVSYYTTWGAYLEDYSGVGYYEYAYKVGSWAHIDEGVITGYEPTYITGADWLATTATIISISIIVILCCLFVYKIIKLIGGLIR